MSDSIDRFKELCAEDRNPMFQNLLFMQQNPTDEKYAVAVTIYGAKALVLGIKLTEFEVFACEEFLKKITDPGVIAIVRDLMKFSTEPDKTVNQ